MAKVNRQIDELDEKVNPATLGFQGVSQEPFSTEARKNLSAPLNSDDVEIKPSRRFQKYIFFDILIPDRRPNIPSRNQIPAHPSVQLWRRRLGPGSTQRSLHG